LSVRSGDELLFVASGAAAMLTPDAKATSTIATTKRWQ
jgi:hypothetical protein